MTKTSTEHQTLEQYQPETSTEEVSLCIICPLETSQRKTEYLEGCIEEWQTIARKTANRLPSMSSHEWSRNNPQLYKIVKNLSDRYISAAVAKQATEKAVEAFDAWRENGYPGDRPIGEFGNGNYLRIHNQQIQIEANDRGYGAKLSLVPRNPEWFHIQTRDYQDDWLEQISDNDTPTRHGSAEVYLPDDGTPRLHLTVVTEAEVVVSDSVERWVGVDIGENTLYAAACIGDSSGTVEDVEIESGREYRHYRERLKEKRQRASEDGDLRTVKKCKGDIERYTEWVLHTASKEIVELASTQKPCGIRMEDLTGYRESADDPIHDWPFADFQEKILYKAEKAGIPVEFVDSSYTSQTCRKCGQTSPVYRNGPDFHCRRCDYEVHADVNAAFNIAMNNSQNQ